jgi:Putative DNA-binding domain
MSTLAFQQKALLDALFAGDGPGSERVATGALSQVAPFVGAPGLRVYRNHAVAQATRCLGAAFPVLAQMLGEHNLAMLARDFWRAHPPVSGDLAQWGGALPDFLQNHDQLAAEPCLPDVARVEWALHLAGHAADQTLDAASFRLLAEHPPHSLSLRLASGAWVLRSHLPVASLVCAHREGTPPLDQIAHLVQFGVAESALVWRQGLRPRVARCEDDITDFLLALLAGAPLAKALDCAPALAFDTWLPQAVESGLVLGVAVQSA